MCTQWSPVSAWRTSTSTSSSATPARQAVINGGNSGLPPRVAISSVWLTVSAATCSSAEVRGSVPGPGTSRSTFRYRDVPLCPQCGRRVAGIRTSTPARLVFNPGRSRSASQRRPGHLARSGVRNRLARLAGALSALSTSSPDSRPDPVSVASSTSDSQHSVRLTLLCVRPSFVSENRVGQPGWLGMLRYPAFAHVSPVGGGRRLAEAT